MNILLSILLIMAGIIVLLLTAALFIKKDHYVRREIVINAPNQKVFEYIRLLKNQDEFNKHAKAGGEREKVYKGTDGTVGFIYAWKGNKDAGEGEKEIRNIVEGKKVEAEIRFVKPMKTSALIIMETESMSEDQTKLYWSNAGTLKYPMNIFVPLLERNLPKDMDASLEKLKGILEGKI